MTGRPFRIVAACGLAALTVLLPTAARPQAPRSVPAEWTTVPGWNVFVDKGCGTCHRVRGVGDGTIGPDLAGTAAAWGPLWGWRVLLWMFAGMAPYRVLMTSVYRRTGSLLLGVLLHAAYTGGQILLEPAAASATQQLLWWGLLDVVLLVVAGCVIAIELRDRRRPVPKKSSKMPAHNIYSRLGDTAAHAFSQSLAGDSAAFDEPRLQEIAVSALPEAENEIRIEKALNS